MMSHKHVLAIIVLIGLGVAVAFSGRLDIAADENSVNSTPVATSIQDGEIISLAKAQLFLASETTGFSIDVYSKDGIVTLKGHIDSVEEKEYAERLIENIDGVVRVNNELTITP
ncbi:BON domain-containing protein [Alteromonas oceanisediminis]|uniref:BON domain-containing protein n=1 Tax=Alteromonas oceanisediminis TaxID=2836180 RepID=UPI001BDAD263|nr:BON domain-containing protein [Alteromonas oceanisediminis]MBT0586678.1 BON domain-containing protein [Alteromonas oceanisediminis]